MISREFSPNKWVQATPDYAFSSFLSHRSGAPDPGRWAAVASPSVCRTTHDMNTMKRCTQLLLASISCISLVSAPSVLAGVLFFEDFETGLVQWTGKTGQPHHGVTVSDPVSSGRGKVLTFTAMNGFGDIFSTSVLSSTNTIAISFDYLGLRNAGSGAGDLGGYFGISDGLPGTQTWLASTASDGSVRLVDDGQWHRVTIFLNGSQAGSFHLMLEDYAASSIPGDTFFDNIMVAEWPLLTINRPTSSQVVVLWPTNTTGYILESTTSLASQVWTQVTNTPGVQGDQFSLVLIPDSPQQCFRLHKR